MSTDNPITYDPDRILTKEQKDINPDTRYWDWFDAWWDQDFSWEGLAKRDIEGSDDDRTLQDYYEALIAQRTNGYSYSDFLIEIDNRQWLCLHAPIHNKEGNLFSRAKDEKLNKIQRLISNLRTSNHFLSAQQYGIIIPQNLSEIFRYEKNIKIIKSMFFMHGQAEGFNITAENSYIHSNQTTQTRSQCRIKLTRCSGIINTIYGNVEFEANGCKFSGNAILGTEPEAKITIKKSEFNNITQNHGAIVDISERTKIDKAQFSGGYPSEFKLTGSKIQNLIIKGVFKSIVIEGKCNGTIQFQSLQILERMHLSGQAERVLCKGTDFKGVCDFKCLKLTKGENNFSLCKFHDEVFFSKSEFDGPANFSNAVFYKRAQFNRAKFHKGADFSRSNGEDSTMDVRGFGRIDFSNAEFHQNDEGECVNFTNAQFNARAIFDEVMFDGVPDFSGATLHADTSFQKLQSFKDIEGKKNTKPGIYQRYHNAFRILRQHMERNTDYATAFFFGRLEQKAKRRMPGGMPKWELFGSVAYELFADFGQNALMPALWLAAAWLFASIGYSAIAQPNNEIVHGFESAMAHAYANALPPISYLISGYFKPNIDATTTFIDALKYHPVRTGVVMTIHALFSASMVFFLLLALKRRFQIR